MSLIVYLLLSIRVISASSTSNRYGGRVILAIVIESSMTVGSFGLTEEVP